MSEVVKITKDAITNSKEKTVDNFTLKGLSKGKIGFILSPPDIGKSYLSLSIAYSLASEKPLLPVVESNRSFKTLYWPAEDGVELALQRVDGHTQVLGDEFLLMVEEMVGLFKADGALTERSGVNLVASQPMIDSLINAAKDFDVLIIDTLREAFGPADEVEDDYLIKTILQTVAKEADVSILAVHHPNKNVARGIEKLSSVSGSGLSRTIANARLLLYLEPGKPDKDKGPTLKYLKANLLRGEERQDIPLEWTSCSLLKAHGAPLVAREHIPGLEAKVTLAVDNKKEQEPKIIDLSAEEELNKNTPNDPDAEDFFSSVNKNLEK
jgi:RecA-family ATPase